MADDLLNERVGAARLLQSMVNVSFAVSWLRSRAKAKGRQQLLLAALWVDE
jgi:hypothetical protein